MTTPALSLNLGSNQPSSSASFANPLAPTPLQQGLSAAGSFYQNTLDPAIHNLIGANGVDFSKGQIAPGAYASGPSQNYSPVNTSNVPSGGASQLQQLAAIGNGNRNPVQETEYQQLLAQQKSAAQSVYDAQNQALNTQFDQSAADLQSQLPYLQQQRDSALAGLNLANDTATNQANSARLSAQNSTNDQINQAGDVAHQTQNQNRNILRALGIGGGTYAAELLSKPLNTYDQVRGQLGQALTQRLGDIENWISGVVQQHSQAVSDLQNNYANLVGKIQSDLRFNDRQRNDALAAANAALQTNLANIQSSAQQYAQQAQLMKMQLAQGYQNTIANYTNPTYDPNQFSADLLSNTNSGNQFSTGNLQALIADNQKKNQLAFNPLQNGNTTLSGLGATG